MPPAEELVHLLAGAFDGPPETARDRRLGELLRDHPELHDDYLDHVRLHALLRWRAGRAVPSTPESPPSPRWTRRGLAAVLTGMAAGLAALLLGPARQAGAADVLGPLVDLNLDLAELESLADRRRVYEDRSAGLRAQLAVDMAETDRPVAEALLANAAWLAGNDDPVAAAERFGDVADALFERLDEADEDQSGEERVARLADAYRRVTDRGIRPNLERAKASKSLDFSRKRQLERAILRDDDRAERVAKLLERKPNASRKAIRKALGTGHDGAKRRKTATAEK